MTHSEVMNQLKLNLDILNDLIEPNSEVVFVDYPIYLNVGDLIIWSGTEKFFKENQINVVYRAADLNFDIKYIKDKYPNSTVICQGGGNFGDTYLSHQKVRDELVREFNGKIIVLPQSVNFENEINKNQVFENYNEHKNLYLCARDEYSLEYFNKITEKAYLLPDMAHYLWESEKSYTLGKNTLSFIRNDNEASVVNSKYLSHESKDWSNDFSTFDKLTLKFFQKIAPYCKSHFLANSMAYVWGRYSEYKLFKTRKIFLKNNFVITSRLHGHIYSCLYSIPNKIIDNSYKKNSRYYKLWTIKSDITSSE